MADLRSAACVPCEWWWPVECDDHGAERVGDLLCPRCGRLGGFRSAVELAAVQAGVDEPLEEAA